jgi:hypothetical protein
MNVSSTPEPSTWLLLGTGILALAAGLYLKSKSQTSALVLAR